MTSSLLLVFATRYDVVTRRTCAIAQRLLAETQRSGVTSIALVEATAMSSEFLKAVVNRPAVVAFYCHGDLDGRIIAQDGEPCWSSGRIPSMPGTAIFAHACRAARWLADQAQALKARILIGYECDLKTPADGSDRFWEMYEQVHCFWPLRLALGEDQEHTRLDFYDLCTNYIHDLYAGHAALMEIIAVQQSRDEIVYL